MSQCFNSNSLMRISLKPHVLNSRVAPTTYAANFTIFSYELGYARCTREIFGSFGAPVYDGFSADT